MKQLQGNNAISSSSNFAEEYVKYLTKGCLYEEINDSTIKYPFLELMDYSGNLFKVLIRNSTRGDEFGAEGEDKIYPVITSDLGIPTESDKYSFPVLYKEGGIRIDSVSNIKVGDKIFFSTPVKIKAALSTATYHLREQSAIVDWLYTKFKIGFRGAAILVNERIIDDEITGYPVPYFASISVVDRDDGVKQTDVSIDFETFINFSKNVTEEALENILINSSLLTPEDLSLTPISSIFKLDFGQGVI